MRPKFAMTPFAWITASLRATPVKAAYRPGNRKAVVIAARAFAGEGHRSITLLKNLARPDLAPDIMSRDVALRRQEAFQ